ncbi:hypothetical protein [Cellulosimicrobium cellulans]|uniref:hypothetical protein n=1 Tax=Cellulosimicrobium cellulans TaxID=1710 RepID=UPI001BA88482|nr:hypothetical protein [Cellulosimicrobium cellulans]QUC00415.1 hypothetical protein J5A69_03940 [Cellulosimicrobium cellulans]
MMQNGGDGLGAAELALVDGLGDEVREVGAGDVVLGETGAQRGPRVVVGDLLDEVRAGARRRPR